MKALKTLVAIALSTVTLGSAVAIGVAAGNKTVEKAEAAISSTVTRVYIEDQVNSNTTVLSIESISFASGYGHDQWRSFLTSYLGARSSYTTTSGSAQPSTKGWSYMSSTETEKYLLCPSGSKNFTMVFPEWVTAFSYKAVGNNWWNWFGVNGSAVGLHSGWGIGKKVNSYIYNDGGWKMNANLDNTAQTNTWGDVTITAIATKSDGSGSELARKSITMSKYYTLAGAGKTYNDVFGHNFAGWYTSKTLNTQHTALITASATAYAKETPKEVAYLSGTMNNWSQNDSNYLMAPTENEQYYISTQLTADTEFKVICDGNWYGWNQVDQSSSIVGNHIVQGTDPDSTGARIKVVTTAKYSVYIKTNYQTNKLWIQIDPVDEATAWATTFLSSTGTICSTGGESANHLAALTAVWPGFKSSFEGLTKGARDALIEGTANQTIADAHDRYVLILTRYPSLDEFGEWTVVGSRAITPLITDNNGVAIIIAVSSAIVIASTAGYFFLRKKRKEQ